MPNLTTEYQQLREWLFAEALPLWSTSGVDRVRGGFFEKLGVDGASIEEPRRTRLVARQIYAFATAARLSWDGPARALVRHGLTFLTDKMVKRDHTVVSSVDPAGKVIDGDFDLYDHAFALFAMAAAAQIEERRNELAALAVGIREAIIAGWRHPAGGFEESNPRTLPLKAHPHMHMFEASLAWAALDVDSGWDRLADEIAELCLARFLAPGTGALHEYLDGDWRLMSESPLDVVEPGHQFEWAWLLIRWGTARKRPDAIVAARRLIDLAESAGVSPTEHLAVNELNADLSLRDGRHRLWPQTERIKAFVALASISDGEARVSANNRAAEAVAGLRRFWVHPIAGSWWEHLDPSGQPASEPARASSLYHIICAFSELAAVQDRRSDKFV